ncbi:hypothetical protein YC2023_018087 [Brassica napus]
MSNSSKPVSGHITNGREIEGRTMEIEHCMHELIPFLDILCAMSRLLVLRVNHLKDHVSRTS